MGPCSTILSTHLLLLLQSALQPLWVLACSTIVQYSQQEGFYRVPLPAARQTPNLEDQWLERSNSLHQVSPHAWNDARETPAAEGGTMDEKFPRILPKVATSTWLLGSFTCRKFTTWDQRLYFPSEGRRAEEFFARKIRRLRPGLNPRTRVPKASTLTSRPPKPPVLTSASKSPCFADLWSVIRVHEGRYTLSDKLSDFTMWPHTWRKNWVICAVLIGNSAGLSHRELRSSLRESHSFLSLYLPTPRWHHPKAHPFLAIHSADQYRMIYSFSNTTSYCTFYAFFSSFRII